MEVGIPLPLQLKIQPNKCSTNICTHLFTHWETNREMNSTDVQRALGPSLCMHIMRAYYACMHIVHAYISCMHDMQIRLNSLSSM